MNAVDKVRAVLTDELRRGPWRGSEDPLAGHCYVASEALYHLFGGPDSGWHPQFIRHEDQPHWFLRHDTGVILDATATQFQTAVHYNQSKGVGFLTRHPSQRARTVLQRLQGAS